MTPMNLSTLWYHIIFFLIFSKPTRVTDNSATIIDNIFTDATDFEALSGNILNQLADHFSQFLILKITKNDLILNSTPENRL